MEHACFVKAGGGLRCEAVAAVIGWGLPGVRASVQRPVPGGPVTVHTDDGSRIEADEILVRTGRRPAVGAIGLDTIGLEPHGPVEVDASMRATVIAVGSLFAVGGLNGRHLPTHMGK